MDMGGAHGILPLPAELHCCQWVVTNTGSQRCPWLNSINYRTKPKDMNVGNGFVGKSVREMEGEVNKKALGI